MNSTSKTGDRTPVLIVGGGPVGLALAADLGWRGVPCLVVEQGASDLFINHPRANFVNNRSMEFCRRWGIAERVREVATAPDYPHTAMYVTSMNGYEIARIDPTMGAMRRCPIALRPRSAAIRSGSIRSCGRWRKARTR